MERHAYPTLADLPVTQVGREDVLRVLTPLWTAHPDVARKMRTRVRAVLAWAQAHGHIDHNPAGEAIDGALAPMPAVAVHFRALPYREVAAALAAVEGGAGALAARACLRFLALTGRGRAKRGSRRGARSTGTRACGAFPPRG